MAMQAAKEFFEYVIKPMRMESKGESAIKDYELHLLNAEYSALSAFGISFRGAFRKRKKLEQQHRKLRLLDKWTAPNFST